MRPPLFCLALLLAGCGAESPEDWSWAAPPALCPTDRGRCSEPDEGTDDEMLVAADAGPCSDGNALDCSSIISPDAEAP